MILLDKVVTLVLLLLGVILGYKMGKGEAITIPRKMKQVLRSEESEEELARKLRR